MLLNKVETFTLRGSRFLKGGTSVLALALFTVPPVVQCYGGFVCAAQWRHVGCMCWVLEGCIGVP